MTNPLTVSISRLRWWIFFALLSAFFTLICLELTMGSVTIPLKQVIAVLFGLEVSQDSWSTILLQLRLPRIVTAALAGAGLATCGLQLQTLFRNPLAGPWAMGVTAGSQVGAAFIVVAAGSTMPTVFQAFRFAADLSLITGAALGSVGVMLILLLAAPRVSAVSLLILGLMLQFMAQGIASILTHFANENIFKVYGSWNEANYNGVTWDRLSILAPIVLIGMLVASLFVKSLNILLLGESYAQTLGINVTRDRLLILSSVILTSGAITAYCGPVSFLDIIVPHMCRGLLRTSDHRLLLPASILVGSVLGLTGDLLINLPWEQHFLHLNPVHAIIGGPVVVWLMFGRRYMRDIMT